MQIKERLQKLILKNSKINIIVCKVKEHLWYYIFCAVLGMYVYGIAVNSFIAASNNFMNGTQNKTFSLNPFKCIMAVFTPQSIGIAFFVFIMYLLITNKWLLYFISGVKITKDERNFYVMNEGTHGKKPNV